MRKLYISVTVLLSTFYSSSLFAANIVWIGNSGDSWNTASNWAPATVPSASDFVTFNTTGTVNVDVASISVAGITVTANSNVVLSTALSVEVSLSSTSAVTPALKIDNGSTLKCLTTDNINLHVFLLAGAIGSVDGSLIMEGAVVNTDYGSSLTLAATALVTVNGIITMNPNSGFVESTNQSLVFNAGSVYNHNRDVGLIPNANYNTTSTINLTGTKSDMPAFLGAPVNLGNLTVNLPNLDPDNPNYQYYDLSLPENTIIKGSLKIQNTNGNIVSLLAANSIPPHSIVVQKNLEISGNSYVELANTNPIFAGDDNILQVNGDFIVSSGSFSLQRRNLVTGTTRLAIKGNINQTGGIITTHSVSSDATKNLFVIELNGNAAQTITSSTNTFDNATNMVALRLNNTAGGVTLLSPLSVGRVDFASGILSTTISNSLAINSLNNDAIVVNNPSATSYISGPVTRNTNATTAYLFPTGKNGLYRPIEIIPTTGTPSSYTAEYFKIASNLPVVSPLNWISKEYWAVNKSFGSDAVVQLSITGVIPGTTSTSEVMVAQINSGGTQWSSVKGATGTSLLPGNVPSGTVRSSALSNLSLFTFGIIGFDALPVILLDFTAKKSGAGAILKWKVDGADIPQSVEIMKSSDGVRFDKIGTVAGINTLTDYSFTDPVLASGNNYYRLRMIDIDGTITFSKIAALTTKDNGIAIASMAPTLVTNSAKLTITADKGGQMDIYVTDITGRTWRKFGVTLSAGTTEQSLNLSDLSAGAYQLVGYMNGQQTQLIRFVKK